MNTTTLQIAPDLFWGLVALTGFLLLVALIFGFMYKPGNAHVAPLERLQKSMRLDGLHPGLFFIALIIWMLLFISLTLGLLWVIWSVIWTPAPNAPEAVWDFRFALAKLTAMTAVLGAVVALPFTVIRIRLLHQQSETAQEALFNDKINAASRDLSARRTITRRVREVTYSLDGTNQISQEFSDQDFTIVPNATNVRHGLWEFINAEEDDLVTRAAAIDRLEGLANERPDEAPRIARMLSIYIRELSREFPARNHPRAEWKNLTDPTDDTPPMAEEEALHHLNLHPDNVTLVSLKNWTRGLKPIRPDMEKAAQTLGQLKDIPGVTSDNIEIDLRGANLQGFDLRDVVFNEARLNGARMEGIDLSGARMEEAVLAEARMEGAILRAARMEGAILVWARMEEADLGEARMEGAILGWARMEGAILRAARMEGAFLGWARMEGAILRAARMDGAFLRGARFNKGTSFQPATLRGAGWKDVDCTAISHIADYLEEIFGDTSVTLPHGVVAPPHWETEVLDWDEFEPQWRAFQRSIGYTPTRSIPRDQF